MEALSSCYSCFMSDVSGPYYRWLSLEPRFSRGCMKEELLGEILRPISRALGWIVAGALIMLFVYAVVVYVVPALRRHVRGNE